MKVPPTKLLQFLMLHWLLLRLVPPITLASVSSCMRRVSFQLPLLRYFVTMTDSVASTSKAVASEASTSRPAKSAGTDKSSKAAGKRPQHGRRDDPPDVRISKALSYILRHGAAKESLTMRPDGFIRVDELVCPF